MNPYQFLAAFILGVIFGWIYARTKSVWLCFICHAIYNSFIISARLLMLSIPGYTPDFQKSDSAHFQPLWFNLAGLLLIAVGLWGGLKTLPSTVSSPEPPPHTNETVAP
jgi:sulfite exporter TauE/SafE